VISFRVSPPVRLMSAVYEVVVGALNVSEVMLCYNILYIYRAQWPGLSLLVFLPDIH
jgi:hypothetical protein